MVAVLEDRSVFTLGEHTIRCLPDVRVLLVDDRRSIRLSPTEFRIISTMLDGRPVGDCKLARAIFGDDDFWALEALEKHMENIRRKFKRARLSLSVLRVSLYGYVLAPEEHHKRRRRAA